MVKKIVDVPDNATNVDFKYVKATALSDYMVGHQTLSVYKMPDAPENPVIELPAGVIDYLVKTKRLVSINNVLDFLSVLDDNPKVLQCVSIDEVAEWYLENVEFVAKKEPKFYVLTDFGTLDARDKNGTELVSFEKLQFLNQHGHYYEFAEETADKLVAGLTSLNARKVKVEE